MRAKILIFLLVVLPISVIAKPLGTSFSLIRVDYNAVVLQRNNELLKVEFVTSTIVRIQYTPADKFEGNGTIICLPQESQLFDVSVEDGKDCLLLKSNYLQVQINKMSGAIQYFSESGVSLLTEDQIMPRVTEKIDIKTVEFDESAQEIQKTADGDRIVSNISDETVTATAFCARQQFLWQDGEALYGLGSHQEDYMNLRGKSQYLYQHNLKATVPVLLSTNGYGLLFDAGCMMSFHDGDKGGYLEMEAVNQVDYYFMYGPSLDKVVANYRQLTGKVGMLPKYMFGYIQSKERYCNPHEIDSVVTRFRDEQIPLDVVVQDWNYWKGGWWGHKKFDEEYYPNPAKMIKDVHDKNVHFMLSIWPSVSGNEADEMGAKGYVIGRGHYNPFEAESRAMYWDDYVNKNLFSLGVDAWWCDSTEPMNEDWGGHANAICNNPQARYELNSKALRNLLGAFRANTYSLYHSLGIYENQRKVTNEKRVVNLTRSAYAGQQRYGTIVWNGDTKANWTDFAGQISSGLNFMATGCPYWTIDAGAFFVSKREPWFWQGDFENGPLDLGYREFYARNIQYCLWLPIFRSHGTDFAREPWQFGSQGEPFYDSIIKQIKLRYRLLPYIYSLASMVSYEDYTMTRLLAFDFMNDSNVYNLKDQFMFGPAFMACPVTEPMYYTARSSELFGIDKTRQVYLPSNTLWYDFWDGKAYEGGRVVKADAPIDRIPVYVRAGSIVPMGPVLQYVNQENQAPLEVRVYPGHAGSFTLYADEGDNYNYEKGQYSTIRFDWDDKGRLMTIGKREGSYKGMPEKLQFGIILVEEGKGIGLEDLVSQYTIVNYEGETVQIKL